MMNTNRSILLLWLAAGLFSCEKVVDFQSTAYQPKLVLYGALFADSIPEVMVGTTKTYYGWEEGITGNAYVEGATVALQADQARYPMSLGNFTSDYFDIWRAEPSGYERGVPSRYRVRAEADSTFRYYEGTSALKGGEWYDFSASYEALQAERRVYIPRKPTGLSWSLRVRDTSYRQEEDPFRYNIPFEAQVRTFELVIQYTVADEQPLWHKPLITYRGPVDGYYLVDPSTGFLEWVDDSIQGKFLVNTPFGQTTGPGEYEMVVELGYYEYRHYDEQNGFSRVDTVVGLPMGREQGLQIARGDSIVQDFELSGLLSYNQDETFRVFGSLAVQSYSNSDPFSFYEPAIVDLGEGKGVGMIGGFSASESLPVRVKFY